jgi:hypothetical protein
VGRRRAGAGGQVHKKEFKGEKKEKNDDVLSRRKPLIQALAEPLRQLDRLLITQQADHVAGSIVNGGAVLAALEMVCNAVAHLRREVTFHVVGEFFPDVAAVDFYDLTWRRHRSSDHPMPHLAKGDKA